MVLKNDSGTPPLSRKTVFAFGMLACAVLGVLIWVYVPVKVQSTAEKITFSQNKNKETANEQTENSSQTSVVANVPPIAPEEAYKKYCSQCHGADGQGDTPMSRMAGVKPTNLVTGPYKYARTVEAISTLIQKGNGNSMPAFGRELGESNSNALAAFALQFEKKASTETKAP